MKAGLARSRNQTVNPGDAYEHAIATGFQARFAKRPMHHFVDGSFWCLGWRATKLVVARKTVESKSVTKRLDGFAVAARNDWFHARARRPLLVLSQRRGGQTACHL